MSSDKCVDRAGHDRLWRWFSLSYVSWLTLPRSFMHEMPDEWQEKMAALLEEWDQVYVNPPDLSTVVSVKRGAKFAKVPGWITNYRRPDKQAINACKKP